jgi:hypothetical protein
LGNGYGSFETWWNLNMMDRLSNPKIEANRLAEELKYHAPVVSKTHG